MEHHGCTKVFPFGLHMVGGSGAQVVLWCAVMIYLHLIHPVPVWNPPAKNRRDSWGYSKRSQDGQPNGLHLVIKSGTQVVLWWAEMIYPGLDHPGPIRNPLPISVGIPMGIPNVARMGNPCGLYVVNQCRTLLVPWWVTLGFPGYCRLGPIWNPPPKPWGIPTGIPNVARMGNPCGLHMVDQCRTLLVPWWAMLGFPGYYRLGPIYYPLSKTAGSPKGRPETSHAGDPRGYRAGNPRGYH